MHIYLRSMQKTSAKLQNNRRKTVRGVAPTRYPLSKHFDSISYQKRPSSQSRKTEKTNQSIIPKPHAHLHSMPKTFAKFQNNRWKTARGVAPTRYPIYFYLKGYGMTELQNDGRTVQIQYSPHFFKTGL